MMREAEMLEPFRHWLRRTHRVGSETVEATELPWLGRRVDLATATGRGLTTAYEMKLRDNTCGIMQAAKNAHAFSRSYLVTATMPSASNLSLARDVGIGVIYLTPESVSVVMTAPIRTVHSDIRSRLLTGIKNARNSSRV